MDGSARSLLDWLGGRGVVCGWDALIAAGVAHSVSPQLLDALKAGAARGVDVPAAAIQCAWLAAIAQRREAAAAAASLEPALAALHAVGITAIVLKGAHLAHFAYADPGDRPMRDLDLLVPLDRIADAEDALVAIGYRGTREQPVAAYVDRIHELPELVADGRLPVELHWALVPPVRALTIDPAALFARSVATTIDGVPARVLAWEDALLHICVHAAGEDHFGLKGLRPLLDIAAIIGTGRIDWFVLAERAEAWRAERPLALGLALTAQLLGTALPDPAMALAAVPRGVLRAAAGQVVERPGMRVEAPMTPPVMVHMLRHPGVVWRFFVGRAASMAAPARGTRRRLAAAGGWIRHLVVRRRTGDRALLGGLARRVGRGVVIDRWLTARSR